MKSNAIVSALVAMSLAMGGPVFGQGDGDEQARAQAQRQAQRQSQRQFPQANPPRAQRPDQQQRPRAMPPQSQRGYQQQPRPRNFEQQRPPGYRQPGQRAGPYPDERGAGPDRQYRRGDRLPQEYRHPNYVVNNWREHNLSPPPRGYHWVQTGADYVLVAIATGIILQLLLNN